MVEDDKKKLLDNALIASKYIKSRLETMNFKSKPEIRVKGLAIGVVFENSEYSSAIISRAFRKGLLIASATSSDFIMFPALDIDKKTLKEGLDISESCIWDKRL